MVLASKTWLSLTPEPERELPDAIATLRAGGRPTAGQVAVERERAGRLVRRANRRAWRRWLGEARGLARSSREGGDPQVAEAAELAVAVIDNHDALALGITPRGRGAKNE
jgi:hypothetical protein